MTMYDVYKPLRNYLRQFPLIESLAVVRAYMQHLQFGQGFAADMDVDPGFLAAKTIPEKRVFEWELDILAREIVLNSPDHGPKTLRSWPAFAGAINKIKDLENEVSATHHDLVSKNILLELYRIAHRQFPWQRRPRQSELIKYFKIFGTPAFQPILQQKIGMSAAELYTMGLAVGGHFLRDFGFNLPAKIEIPGITPELFDRFISHFSTDMDALRKKMAETQSYDQDYAYTFNPLRSYPLVRTKLRNQDCLIAPIPTFLLKRFSEGLYYEIFNADGFSAAFGPAFQKYVGDAIAVISEPSSLTVSPEQRYRVGKDEKDSVDWIVSDTSGHLFVECKTKKLRYGAKIGLASTEILDEDLEKMSSFIVQTYKTLLDGLQSRYPSWKPDKNPVYPLIVTLEEWFAFGDKILPAIDERVARLLRQSGLSTNLLQQHPYSICSVDDFEDALQIMKAVGIQTFMEIRFKGEHRLWSMRPIVLSCFRNESSKLRHSLFPDEIKKIHPAISA